MGKGESGTLSSLDKNLIKRRKNEPMKIMIKRWDKVEMIKRWNGKWWNDKMTEWRNDEMMKW